MHIKEMSFKNHNCFIVKKCFKLNIMFSLSCDCMLRICVEEVCVGEICVGEICIGEICVGDICVGEICVGENCVSAIS